MMTLEEFKGLTPGDMITFTLFHGEYPSKMFLVLSRWYLLPIGKHVIEAIDLYDIMMNHKTFLPYDGRRMSKDIIT